MADEKAKPSLRGYSQDKDLAWNNAIYWIGRFEDENPLIDGRFLLTITSSSFDNNEHRSIAGTIDDCFGKATFEGFITPKTFYFIKEYASAINEPFIDAEPAINIPVLYEGVRSSDKLNVVYEGPYKVKSDKPYSGKFSIISQGTIPLDTTAARLKVSWAAARRIPYPYTGEGEPLPARIKI